MGGFLGAPFLSFFGGHEVTPRRLGLGGAILAFGLGHKGAPPGDTEARLRWRF